MAAEFEQGFFGFGEAAWHGLGELRPGKTDWNDIPAFAPLYSSMVHQEPVYQRMANGEYFPVSNSFLNVRERDSQVVGIVKGKYTILQSLEAASIVKPLIDAGVASVDNVFTLKNGKMAIMVLRWNSKDDSPDPMHKFLSINNSFDGSAPLQVFFGAIREVCANTVRIAVKETENMMVIRHTESSEEKLKEARKMIETATKYFSNMDRIFEDMKKKTFTIQQLIDVVKKTWKMKVGEDVSKKTITTNTNLLKEIIRLTEEGKGVDLPGVKGTAWGAFNAISEYTDHYSTVKIHGTNGDENIRNAKEGEARVISNLWGTSNDFKNEALENILEMVQLAA